MLTDFPIGPCHAVTYGVVYKIKYKPKSRSLYPEDTDRFLNHQTQRTGAPTTLGTRMKQNLLGLLCLVALLVSGCSTEDMVGTMSSLTGERRMPDLLGKNLAEANARVVLVGLGPITQFNIGGDRSCAIDLTHDNQIVVIEKGQICQQDPIANRVLSSQTTKVAVIVQQEDPWHGHYKGDPTDPQNQWHRMPKVIGMAVADAKDAIKKAGFTIEKLTEIIPTGDPICNVGQVCKQYPEPLHTNRQSAKRTIWVGAEAPPPAATPPSDKGGKATGAGEKKKGEFDF